MTGQKIRRENTSGDPAADHETEPDIVPEVDHRRGTADVSGRGAGAVTGGSEIGEAQIAITAEVEAERGGEKRSTTRDLP